ncbi:MAG: GHKL domain-containing protein, partial [Bacteroidaceae bacterium]|nr:GHKL domain-containing protein [Bacteroidaceae bacterium]
GLKSIRQVAEKYQGGMSIDLENNWFKIRVLLGMSAYSRK